jgi:hypothetical protein
MSVRATKVPKLASRPDLDTASTHLVVMLARVYGFADNHGRCRHVGGTATSQRKSGTRSIVTSERGK